MLSFHLFFCLKDSLKNPINRSYNENDFIAVYILHRNNLILIKYMQSSKSSRKDKKQSKSAQKRQSIKKKQLNLLAFNNEQIGSFKIKIDDSRQQDEKALLRQKLQRRRASSSMGPANYESTRNSIDLLMGGKKISLSNLIEEQFKISTMRKPDKNMYEYIHVIGKGGFGRVYKVLEKKTGILYAMKQMSKAVIMTKKSIESVRNERKLLTFLKHKFLVNMRQAFQDRETLYLIMDLMPGGDLRYHICKKHKFTQQQIRFFAACICQGLQFVHSKNIIHRDIKPQNLVFDNQGYLHLTDLGIAKEFKEQNSNDTSGTPGYMAPEVMTRQNHSFEVDYYALGVILYELMMGKRPYQGRSRKQIRQQILAKQVVIKKKQIPEGWSIQIADFINKLLQRRPVARLGWGGAEEVKYHSWLKDFPWNKLADKELASPFKQFSKYNAEDVRYQKTKNSETYQKTVRENQMILRKSSLHDLFEEYTFVQEEDKLMDNQTTSSELSKKKNQKFDKA